jgi:hypothetical protein
MVRVEGLPAYRQRGPMTAVRPLDSGMSDLTDYLIEEDLIEVSLE